MDKRFTHLHVHTEYSLLDGASKIPELISYAKELGMDSIAITDHGNMCGAVEFYQECEKQGLNPIIGCEVYVAEGSRLQKNNRGMYHLILLAENNEGYHNLMKIVSAGQVEGFYYKPRVDKDVLRAYSKGIICLSACIAGELPVNIINNNMDGARRVIKEFIDIFGKDNYFLEMQDHELAQERKTNEGLIKLAKEFGLGLVCTNDLHYVHKEDAEAQDVLLCIQTTSTVDEPNRMRFPNDSFYLKSYDEMAEKFSWCPEAMENTNKIADRCHVTLEFGKLLLPKFETPDGSDEKTYLRYLCDKNMERCYPNASPEVYQRLEFELGIINQMGYAAYFLIVWDFIDYCNTHDIPVGPGRGSAAGSIVAYLLGITKIDPLKYDLLFERFLNPERVSMPDIDTDFCYRKRDKVLDYVVRKYSSEHVAQIITFGTLQARAAVRDVGRALAMTYHDCDVVAKAIPRELGITLDKALKQSNDFRAMYEENPDVKHLVDLSKGVEGLPRNYGTHAAGVIIAPSDLRDYVPLQLDSEGANIITEYDKNRVEELGLLKMDFLGLRTLTVIDDAIKFIKATTGETLDIDKIDLADEKTCAMLRKGDTFGVFQLESAGITNLLVQLAPTRFEDLIPLVALYRPGPLETGMAEDFIAGRHGKRTARVLHPLIEPILKDTYGVILYQEQVMQITSALAGFSLGKADILRRAMGKKKAKVLESQRADFVKGAKDLHNVPEEVSNEIFDLLLKFAGYGFNKSHSVAYALVAYQTAYLKAHYPSQFMAAFLNSVITDSDKLSWYISVCRNAGIKILPPDVNESYLEFTVDKQGNIRFGLAGIKSVGDNAVNAIIAAREDGGPFTSFVDFCKRVSMRVMNRRVLENLIKCSAMNCFGVKRSQMLAILESAVELAWSYQKDNASGQLNLFGEDSGFAEYNDIPLPDLPEIPTPVNLANEKELLGFYVTGHPLEAYKEVLKKYMPLFQFLGETEYQDGMQVKVAGIISDCVIKNTKKGDSMALLTLEDYSARLPVIIFPKVYHESLRDVMQDNVVAVEGRLNIDERETKIIATRISKLSLEEKPVVQESGKALHLKVEAYLDNPLTQRQLAGVFSRFKGGTVVYLHLMGARKIIKTSPSFWVDQENPELLPALEKVLGKNCLLEK
ncbi:MAG: DNA polymerase III subunit alpha [Phascolarctobacterium sp.]|nr:DNA polymerase III subunit alpha [Phascolarctobacterium sp.]